jgi:AAA+ superfamily predicted ATPase
LSSIPQPTETVERAYRHPLEHLQCELRRLDLILHREILRLRVRYQLSRDESRGIYISDEQVDRLVNQSVKVDDNVEIIRKLEERAAALRREHERLAPPELPWCRLSRTFQLTEIEQDLLLIAIAPELDLKYETLYAYLNNDVTRRAPTAELVMRLLSSDPRVRLVRRSLLLPDATLFASGILQSSPHLHGSIGVAPAVVNYILDQPAPDADLAPYATLYRPNRPWRDVPVHRTVEQQIRSFNQHREPVTLIFEGRNGSGRLQAAEAFAREIGAPMLTFDVRAARTSGTPLGKLLPPLLLHQSLYGAVLCATHAELLLNKEEDTTEAGACLDVLAKTTRPAVLCATGGRWRDVVGRAPLQIINFTPLGCAHRALLWQDAAAQRGYSIDADALDAVSDRFVLTPGQIDRAVDVVVRGREMGDPPTFHTWLEAARSQSDHSLAQLADKVRLVHDWRDIVLPSPILRHLKEITAAIRHRRKVYDEWGFARRISTGTGLKLLFSGPSGTGKTMTAGVMARDLGLDLYKIDLSRVVNKYIGETEKNLDRIFLAAHCSNAVLFFDEADALFGKRSEVKDAHDRYANVEVAYLLQKLEEHDGVVILATNLNKNIDEAFARRMHYVVRLPLPDATDRERLWRGMFPSQAPLAEDIDFEFIATQFSFTGGEIKNVALDAAFRAASDGGAVSMAHVTRAIAQQLMKEGRAPSVAEFGEYYGLMEGRA